MADRPRKVTALPRNHNLFSVQRSASAGTGRGQISRREEATEETIHYEDTENTEINPKPEGKWFESGIQLNPQKFEKFFNSMFSVSLW
jgi:hypothetical protein